MSIIRRVGTGIAALTLAAAGGLALGVANSSATVLSASISGTVRQAGTGTPLAGYEITVLKLETINVFGQPTTGPVPVYSTTSAANGTYSVPVAPNGVGYYVCFSSPQPFAPGQCYLNQLWLSQFPNPFGFVQVPNSATLVKVGNLQHVTGIDDDEVDPAVTPPDVVGSVSGTVTETLIGARLRGVRVSAFSATGAIVSQTLTGNDGTYELDNLLPATNYRVCFDGTTGSGGATLHAYERKCYANVTWSGGAAPIGATHVAVSTGATTTGINVSLGAF